MHTFGYRANFDLASSSDLGSQGAYGSEGLLTFSYWKISLSGLRGQSQWSSGQLIGFKIAIDILTREAGGCRHCKGKTDHFL